MKMMIATAVLALTTGQALASNAQGDGELLFHCQSLPNVDSALTVLGIGDELTSEVEVVVMIAGQVQANDKGILVKNTSKYEGQLFDLEFGDITRITAKAANSVLSVGQSDSLDCEVPTAQ